MKKRVVIVGAGIAGLTAAITLARRDYEVEVLEGRSGIGGPASEMGMGEEGYAMADGTPMDSDRMSDYLGFDIEPATSPLRETRIYCFGKRYDIGFPEDVPSVLVERGWRETSMDMFLFNLARESGVSIHFNHPVRSAGDFRELPPGSILATGLFPDTYRALGLPYNNIYGYLAYKAEGGFPQPRVVICLDRHTWDYAFLSGMNDMAGALIFQRKKPLQKSAVDWFSTMLSRNEGVEFEEWHSLDMGVVPKETMDRPSLFHRGYILAGTLASAQDAILLFGVHGALVSGKVAARAVEDPEGATREFQRITFLRRRSALIRLIMEKTHPLGMRAGARAALSLYPYYSEKYMKNSFAVVPGWYDLGIKAAPRTTP